jgi:hypothetical protein
MPPSEPNQIGNWRLKISYWYITHKLQLKNLLIYFLIGLSVIFYGYSFYKVIKILLFDDRILKQNLISLTQNQIDYTYFHQVNQPRAIEVVSFDTVALPDNRYDFIVKLKNPNEKFMAAKVDLELVSGDRVIDQKSTFIYTNETKYVGFFGEELKGVVNPILRQSGIKWQRITRFTDYYQSHFNFVLRDTIFKSASEVQIRGDLPVSTLSFKIKNDSAYSYWHAGIFMVLLNGSQLVGANYLELDQFKAGEERNIDMRFYESLPEVTSVEILPEVNIYDPEVYMPVD